METALIALAGLLLIAVIMALSFLGSTLIGVVRDMKEILTLTQVNTGKIGAIDNLLVAVHTYMVTDLMGDSSHAVERLPQPGWESMGVGKDEDGKFITEDGVHSADSFEELIGKITKDPRYRVNRPEDIEEIRQKFEEFNELHDDEGFGEEGPPDDLAPGDEWKESL